MRPMSAQDEQDEILINSRPSLASQGEFAALVRAKKEGSPQPGSSTAFDPLENAMKRHPGLTREAAEEMARAFGF